MEQNNRLKSHYQKQRYPNDEYYPYDNSPRYADILDQTWMASGQMVSPAQLSNGQLRYQDSLQRQLWQQKVLGTQVAQPQVTRRLIPVQKDILKQPSSAPSGPSSGSSTSRSPLGVIHVNQAVNIKKPGNISESHQNDYSNHHIHSGRLPVSYISNIQDPIEGYPKLQRLFDAKQKQVNKYATKPYGCRVEPGNIIDTLKNWIEKDQLLFDVIMIGALTENQFIYPMLSQLPLDRLCSKPGFLFIWASTQKIAELGRLLNNNSNWSKKFRRSEELVFVPVDSDSSYYPHKDAYSVQDEIFFQKQQWHCWMCITGTVRRSTDNHLINCNINTDLEIEKETTSNNAVPPYIYQVAENFSSSTRRLHIIPSRTGLNKPVRPRPGWVILSPDIFLNNFDTAGYKKEILRVGTNIPVDEEIEQLRPKSPVQRAR